MVFVFDLDDNEASSSSSKDALIKDALRYRSLHHVQVSSAEAHLANRAAGHQREEPRANPNINSFSAALCCYPIVSSLASFLDLNSLHNLSRTCRQFRGTLLLYRDQLVSRSLRCANEDATRASTGSRLAAAFKESRAAWRAVVVADSSPESSSSSSSSRRLTSGKISQCARDMVAECRRCGVVVCRNCTAKPPPTPALRERHRRLCKTCIKAPLAHHLVPPGQSQKPLPAAAHHRTASPRCSPATLDRALSSSPSSLHTLQSTASSKSSSSLSSSSACTDPHPHQYNNNKIEPTCFTYFAFKRTPCTCPSVMHVCVPCGRSLRAADRQYVAAWVWRSKYNSSFNGMSDGVKGVQCGRGSHCLAVRLVEQEVDVDVDELREMEEEAEKVARQGMGRSWEGGSFAAQEVEGVGGVVKMKVKKLVRIGAEVDACEDEGGDGGGGDSTTTNRVLAREVAGDVRSWCAWCERVVPSASDAWDRRWDIGGDAL